jgi:hypothetical protein
MKGKWSRRKFLKTGLGSTLALGSGTVAGLATAKAGAREKSRDPSRNLSSAQRETLRAAIDEIIPAADGMPAASQVGAVEYLDRQAQTDPSVQKDLAASLAALENLGRGKSRKRFSALSRAERVAALKVFEKPPHDSHFAALRDYVYESYYNQPAVWKLIGYEFHPTNASGPLMKPFDESVLAKVRKMPKRYREAI